MSSDDCFQKLRTLLTTSGLSFLMEAHNGLSAKIVEKAGFEGIWASGFTIAASMCLRDENEASWTQILAVLEFMADATTIPILADCDTGFGNFNNVRRLVKKLCQIGIAGACIEDKIFPKINSYVNEPQVLIDIDEFCGKIKAAKDAQTESNFSLVARVEALIVGLSMDEALKRAVRYFEAGADAILIHSKHQTADEIFEFAKKCPSNIPLVIVPMTYYKTPTEKFQEADIKTIIWPNYNLRASIVAMETISETIHKDQNLIKAESIASSLKEVFDLTNQYELDKARKLYSSQKS